MGDKKLISISICNKYDYPIILFKSHFNSDELTDEQRKNLIDTLKDMINSIEKKEYPF